MLGRAAASCKITSGRRSCSLTRSGQNADLKALAEDTLPTVLEHLQMAQDIATKLWGVGPQGAAPGLSMVQAHP